MRHGKQNSRIAYMHLFFAASTNGGASESMQSGVRRQVVVRRGR